MSTGVPAEIDPARDYVVAASDFLAAGGEGFDAFTRGSGRASARKDVDDLVALLAKRYAP